MYVLIFIAGAYYGNNIAVGPTYPDKAACEAAGAIYVEAVEKRSGAPSRTLAVCVPAPKIN